MGPAPPLNRRPAGEYFYRYLPLANPASWPRLIAKDAFTEFDEDQAIRGTVGFQPQAERFLDFNQPPSFQPDED
jgi:hypothetical protein